MKQIFTEKFFRRYCYQPLNESLRMFSDRASQNSNAKFDIFLSYNIADKEVIEGIYNYLSSLEYKVYLDFKIDPQLSRNNVTKQNAEKVRQRLKNSYSLIFAASLGASLSKWMTWELGIVDGNTSKCMILPVSKEYQTIYHRQEYLQLYPLIYMENNTPKVQDVNGYDLDLKSLFF
nr:hypothetical protein [uncultured Capnocytophaga sp.]